MKSTDIQAIKDLSIIPLPTSTTKPLLTGGVKSPAQPADSSSPVLSLNEATTVPCVNCSNHSNAEVQTIEPIAQNKSDQYFPFYVTLGGNQTQPLPNNGTNPLTESERRRRAIYIASGILLVFVIILWASSRKK